MYNCDKIKRITILYASTSPGQYAGEEREILDEQQSKAICEEANQFQISIESLLKARSRKSIEAVVINTVLAPIVHTEKSGEHHESKAASAE
ncbi:MAG TPA: hypothetical protein VKU79_04200 [Thermoplasmataceae archaeon]|nr:hypothetical protein [Thermoplasmatales archaeon AK]HLH86047.1 hypothetical protein [Thermoplasmataceae archaeon]